MKMIKLIVFDLDSTLAEIAKGIRPETLERLKTFENRGIQIAICSGKPTFYLCGIMRQAELSKMAVVIGSEGQGVRKEILESADAELIIPMNPHCESLNAAVAATIVMWQMKL